MDRAVASSEWRPDREERKRWESRCRLARSVVFLTFPVGFLSLGVGNILEADDWIRYGLTYAIFLLMFAFASGFLLRNPPYESEEEDILQKKPADDLSALACVNIEIWQGGRQTGTDKGWMWLESSVFRFAGLVSDLNLASKDVNEVQLKEAKHSKHMLLSLKEPGVEFKIELIEIGEYDESYRYPGLVSDLQNWSRQGHTTLARSRFPREVQRRYWLGREDKLRCLWVSVVAVALLGASAYVTAADLATSQSELWRYFLILWGVLSFLAMTFICWDAVVKAKAMRVFRKLGLNLSSV
ncbi:MAG: hypothetical protein KF784_08180 [Fimbriimonadaceae bacterium]|nr:hypothetical protein [Fimbriimonadaceae bacterium]